MDGPPSFIQVAVGTGIVKQAYERYHQAVRQIRGASQIAVRIEFTPGNLSDCIGLEPKIHHDRVLTYAFHAIVQNHRRRFPVFGFVFRFGPVRA